MIKLGVQHKDQVKVDSLAGSINSSKLELESINTERESKQKELNDVLTQLDFAVEDLTNKTKQAEIELLGKTEQLNKLDEEIKSLAGIKFELETKLFELGEDIELSKELKSKEISKLELVEGKKLRSLNVEVSVLEARKSELEDFIQVLSIDSLANSVTVENLKEEIAKLEIELVDKRNEDLELDTQFSEVSATNEVLSSEVVSLQADVTNLNDIINSLSTEITKIEEIKSTLTSEVDALNASKEEFNREKLAFQANKELILLREQFIIEKYNLAGVPYN